MKSISWPLHSPNGFTLSFVLGYCQNNMLSSADWRTLAGYSIQDVRVGGIKRHEFCLHLLRRRPSKRANRLQNVCGWSNRVKPCGITVAGLAWLQAQWLSQQHKADGCRTCRVMHFCIIHASLRLYVLLRVDLMLEDVVLDSPNYRFCWIILSAVGLSIISSLRQVCTVQRDGTRKDELWYELQTVMVQWSREGSVRNESFVDEHDWALVHVTVANGAACVSLV